MLMRLLIYWTAMINPLTYKDEMPVGALETSYDLAYACAVTAVASMAMARLTGWFEALDGVKMGLAHAPAFFLKERVGSNRKDGACLKAIGLIDPRRKRRVPKSVWTSGPMMALCYMGVFLSPRYMSGMKNVLKYHIATGILFPLGMRALFAVTERIGIPPSGWFRQYGMREYFQRTSYPAVDARLNEKKLRERPLPLPELNESLAYGGNYSDGSHKVRLALSDARGMQQLAPARRFLMIMANIDQKLQEEPVKRGQVLQEMDRRFERCISACGRVAEDIYRKLVTGKGTIEQEVDRVVFELKMEVLHDFDRFAAGAENTHVLARIENALQDEIGLDIPGGDADAMFKQQLPDIAEHVNRMATFRTHLGWSRFDEATVMKDKAAWLGAFKRAYTASRLVAKVKEYFDRDGSSDLTPWFMARGWEQGAHLDEMWEHVTDEAVIYLLREMGYLTRP